MKSTYNNESFELIVISSPTHVNLEFDYLNQMFQEGLECFHLRKPGLNKAEYLRMLQLIRPKFLKRVMLHDHFELASKYNVRGLHIKKDLFNDNTGNLEEVVKTARRKGLLISSGVHSLFEYELIPKGLNSVFLSPVYDSISKPGYSSKIDLAAAATFLKNHTSGTRVVALGGIDLVNINEVKTSGFRGAALLGAIWQSENPALKFREIKQQVLQV